MEYPDRLTITTPEGVSVDLALAGIGSRFMAAMLDFLIQATIALLGALLLFALLQGGVLTLFLYVGAFLILFGYDVTFEVLNRGRTPGKQATGLRVVLESGAPVRFVPSSIRNVMRIIDILPAFYGIGMLSIFLTHKNQRLGDLAGGTLVVRDRIAAAMAFTAPPPVAAAAPLGWDTSAVTPEDLAIVRAFLTRRATLAPAARANLAQDLAARLRPKVAGAPALDPEPFLEALSAVRD